MQLIEDYERKALTANAMINRLKADRITNTDTFKRLTTKISLYRTFLSELERLEENVDTSKY